MFRNFTKWCFGALTLVFVAGTSTSYAQGEALFKAKCASCHQPHKNGTGPKLFQVRQKWSDGGAKDGTIYQWVNNWQTAAANDPYAQSVSTWSASAMTAFPELKKEDVDAILDWVDAQAEPGAGGGDETETEVGQMDTEESSNKWIWIILGVIFITIILAVGGVRRQLKFASAEDEGEAVNENMTYAEELKAWAWKYKTYVGIGTLVVVISLIVCLFLSLYSIGVVENYQPSQPIAFPHSVHAGTNGID
jgi:cytochrome c551/c552